MGKLSPADVRDLFNLLQLLVSAMDLDACHIRCIHCTQCKECKAAFAACSVKEQKKIVYKITDFINSHKE